MAVPSRLLPLRYHVVLHLEMSSTMKVFGHREANCVTGCSTVIIIMAVNILMSDAVVKTVSYNMHGFNSGLSLLHEMCKTYDIILIQEHWLQSSELEKLNMIDCNFSSLAESAMDTKCANGIIHGRPFGGTGILWRKSLANIGLHIKLLNKDNVDV